MGFARKVGSGVKSFFYEPYQGAVLGPQDFVRGLGKGTHHLITNVVRYRLQYDVVQASHILLFYKMQEDRIARLLNTAL